MDIYSKLICSFILIPAIIGIIAMSIGVYKVAYYDFIDKDYFLSIFEYIIGTLWLLAGLSILLTILLGIWFCY